MDLDSFGDNVDEIELSDFDTLGCPPPSACRLYLVKRESLLKGNKFSRVFCRQLELLYQSVVCQPTCDDLKSAAARPNYLLFCLVHPPKDDKPVKVPQVLCLIVVKLLSSERDESDDADSDDNIVNILQKEYTSDISSSNGCQILKLATHPSFIEREYGYGKRALQLLEEYFNGQSKVGFDIQTDDSVNYGPPLVPLAKRQAEVLDFMGLMFDLDHDFLKTWRKSGYVPVYISLESENSRPYCIMVKLLNTDDVSNESWLITLWKQFRSRFVMLLSSRFCYLKGVFAVELLQENELLTSKCNNSVLSREELEIYLTLHDLKRLRIYTEFRDDYRRITDLLPVLARFFFFRKFGSNFHLSPAQMIILLATGLQGKSIDEVGDELGLPGNQVLAHFLKAIKKISSWLDSIEEKAIGESLGLNRQQYETIYSMKPVEGTLDDELEQEARLIKQRERDNLKRLSQDVKHLSQYAIKGTEDEWSTMLKNHRSVVSIKT